jgi:hypothetical protein
LAYRALRNLSRGRLADEVNDREVKHHFLTDRERSLITSLNQALKP